MSSEIDPQIDKDLLDRALSLLARREHTTIELTRKLEKRGYRRNEIDRVIQHLTVQGYLSMSRFLDDFLGNRLERFVGPLHIQRDLRSRGFTQSEIEAAFISRDIDWTEKAKSLLKKRGISSENEEFVEPKTRSEWKAAHRTLRNRGYPDSVILNLLGSPPI